MSSRLSNANISETTPLNFVDRLSESILPSPLVLHGLSTNGGPDFSDESIDFFKVIVEEMTKINNFFVGKLAELRILLDEITRYSSIMLIYVYD